MTFGPRPATPERAFRVIVTGGGTGGHTYPALTTVYALRRRLAASNRPLEVLWVGTADGLEARVAAEAGIEFRAVAGGKVRRSHNPLGVLSMQNARDMARVPVGVGQARSTVVQFRPDVVLSTGGYIAVPVGVAAGMTRRALVVHEQTVRLGLANRVLARMATRVAVSSASTLDLLPAAARRRAVVTGNPVRPAMLSGSARRAVEVLATRGVSVDPRLPTVYVTGGAQGSVQINTLVAQILPWLLERANVVHQCGPANIDALRAQVAGLPATVAARYLLTGYVGDELPDLLALADVVISRSGAGTIAELTALGKAAVLIPYPAAAGDEQTHNARVLERAGAAVALTGDVTAAQLGEAVGWLLADPGRRARMAQQARAHGRPDAADRLVDVLLDAAGAR